MILSDLKRYLQGRDRATLTDMALHFDADPNVVRAMLDVWVAKGRVERCDPAPDCGGNCDVCGAGAVEIYRWSAGNHQGAVARRNEARSDPDR